MFSKEFKEAAVRRLELGASIAEVPRACEGNPNVLHRWKRELRDYGSKAFAGHGKARAEENHVAELERKGPAHPDGEQAARPAPEGRCTLVPIRWRRRR